MNQLLCAPAQPQSLEELPKNLQKLISLLKSTAAVTPRMVLQCVKQANVQETDLMPWADFNHPVPDSYGRRLVYENAQFEIMAMSWLPGDFSAIHDHGGAEWGAVQCFGQGEHTTFVLRDNHLHTAEQTAFKAGSIVAVDQQLVHQMGNPSNKRFLSLHVYGREQSTTGPITGNARIFDLYEGTMQFTDGGVFFCLPESQIRDRAFGLTADRETTLRHHQQMRDRIARVLETPTDAQSLIWQQHLAKLDGLMQQLI